MKLTKTDLLVGLRFLAILSASSIGIYGTLYLFNSSIESITAMGSAFVLLLLGIPAKWSGSMVHFAGQQARIAWLCTGSLEMAILIGAVIATEDRTWKQRVWGALFSIASVYAVNAIRVGVTLASAVWFNWRFADLIHTVLFKFFLVFAILGLYAIWYIWITGDNQTLETNEKGL